jgi:hypothetical protein
MKTTKPAVILLALVLLTVAIAQSAEKPTKKEILNTQMASCLIKITTDPSILPLNEFAVDYLLRSSGVAGKAAREVLDISPGVASELIEIEEIYSIDSDSAGGMGISTGTSVPVRISPTAARTGVRPAARTPVRTTRTTTPARTKPRAPKITHPLLSADEQTILFRLQVGLDNEIKPAAEEFMMALIENLRSAISGAFDQYSSKLNKQLELADKEAQRAEHQLVQMQAELKEFSCSRDLSRHLILGDISSLRQQIQSTRMKWAADETLYEETAKRVAEEQAIRKKLVEDDPISKEFMSILAVHEKRLKETQKLYESGRASGADLEDVKEKIIRARIELAKRQEEVSNPPGSIVLRSLSDEMADLLTKVALAQQEIRSLEEQLKEAEELLGKADDYELLSLKADIARQNLEETLLWRARLSRNIRSIQPPDVTVIGAE